jgi:threonine synthase
MKLVQSRVIPRSSRVVVISTAHGLKFTEFKTRFHQGRLPEAVDSSLQNPPIQVPADAAAVRAAIDGRIPA